jgi:hypothetical protein
MVMLYESDVQRSEHLDALPMSGGCPSGGRDRHPVVGKAVAIYQQEILHEQRYRHHHVLDEGVAVRPEVEGVAHCGGRLCVSSLHGHLGSVAFFYQYYKLTTL